MARVATAARPHRNNLKGIARKDIERGEDAPRKHHVSDLEKETIILYNEAEPTAEIFTYNKALQRHLKARFKITPIRDNGEGGLTFQIDKSRLRFPQPKRQMSEKTKKASADRLRKARQSRAIP